jgi:peptidyl-prolyl cis-trans isomerase SurA
MKKIINILIILFIVMLSKSIALENKIILKIENEIITTIDIFNEINYLKFFNNELSQLSDQEIYQIAIQSILKNKIKKIEILKILTK